MIKKLLQAEQAESLKLKVSMIVGGGKVDMRGEPGTICQQHKGGISSFTDEFY